MALGTDKSFNEAGLVQRIRVDDQNAIQGEWKSELLPELLCDEGKDPDLSIGVHQYDLIVSTYRMQLQNRDLCLTIPWR